jgi:hypothetical protein
VRAADAARVCAPAARTLAQALEQATELGDRQRLVQGLASVVERLRPAEATPLLRTAMGKEKDPRIRPSLVLALTGVVGRVEPAKAAHLTAEALEKETDPSARYLLAQGLEAFSSDSAEVARVWGAITRDLAQALERETNPGVRPGLAQNLVSAAGRAEPAEAARLLAETFAKETNPSVRASLADSLVSATGRAEPAHAARVAAGTAQFLARQLEEQRDAPARSALAQGLAAVAGRLDRAEAVRICGAASRTLLQAWEKETEAGARYDLVLGLASLAGQLEPTEVTRLNAAVTRPLLRQLKPGPRGNPFARLEDVAYQIYAAAGLLQQMDDAEVGPTVRTLARHIAAARDANGSVEDWSSYAAEDLQRVLTDASRLPVRRRAAALTAAVGTGAGGPLAGLSLAPAAGEPLPCRLATQDLVDLLKLPTCVRETRRAVLDLLGNRYGRRFVTHWEFVRYAREKQLNLDFTTPPRRPD